MVHAEVQTDGLVFTEPNWDTYSEDGDDMNCWDLLFGLRLDALQEDVAAFQKLGGTHSSPDVTDASSGLAVARVPGILSTSYETQFVNPGHGN